MKLIIRLVFFSIIVCSCAGRRICVRNVDGMNVEIQMSSKISDILYGKWLNSFEEQANDGILIYRPTNFPFPASKIRTGLEFTKEGKFLEYTALNEDSLFKLEGEWIYSHQSQTLEITFSKLETKPLPVTVKSKDGYVLSIEKLENGLLKVRKKQLPAKESLNAKKN